MSSLLRDPLDKATDVSRRPRRNPGAFCLANFPTAKLIGILPRSVGRPEACERAGARSLALDKE